MKKYKGSKPTKQTPSVSLSKKTLNKGKDTITPYSLSKSTISKSGKGINHPKGY